MRFLLIPCAVVMVVGDTIPYACSDPDAQSKFPFCNTSLALEERLDDLVSRIMSLGTDGIANENFNTSSSVNLGAMLTARNPPAIPELGIPAYDWGVNSIHGIQTTCGENCATNYPTPMAMGATFDLELIKRLSNMMAVELRALRRENSTEHVGKGPWVGLDSWTPNVRLSWISFENVKPSRHVDRVHQIFIGFLFVDVHAICAILRDYYRAVCISAQAMHMQNNTFDA